VEQLEVYRKIGPLDSAQEKYSLLDRDLEPEYLPCTRKKKIAVLAYSPLANGLLTGKIGPERQFSPDDLRHNHPRFSVESCRDVQVILGRLRPVAEKHQLTLAQLVIAWTLAQPGVSHALVGARDGEQALGNARAGRAALLAKDLYTINHALPCLLARAEDGRARGAGRHEVTALAGFQPAFGVST
jgi:methylglyoxal reductase